MKRIRKIISILCVLAIVFSSGVVCSAASVSRTGTFNDCTYAISAGCYPSSFGSSIQYQYSDTGDETDYLLQVYVEYNYVVKVGISAQHYTNREYSTAYYGFSGINRSVDNMEWLYTSYYINTVLATNEILFPD